MRYLSFLLFPFALLYGAIVRLRHWCYNVGIFKEHTFAVPTICVGNVAVGGTARVRWWNTWLGSCTLSVVWQYSVEGISARRKALC